MEKLQKEITLLDEAIFAKIDSIKCVETRLENRTCRPGFELCRDQSQDGLKQEVLQLRQTKQNLINEINSAKLVFIFFCIFAYNYLWGKKKIVFEFIEPHTTI